jgi:hypothetical protein
MLTTIAAVTAATVPPSTPAQASGNQAAASSPTAMPPTAVDASLNHHLDLRHHERITVATSLNTDRHEPYHILRPSMTKVNERPCLVFVHRCRAVPWSRAPVRRTHASPLLQKNRASSGLVVLGYPVAPDRKQDLAKLAINIPFLDVSNELNPQSGIECKNWASSLFGVTHHDRSITVCNLDALSVSGTSACFPPYLQRRFRPYWKHANLTFS